MWSRFNGVAGNLRTNISQFAADVQQQLREEESDGESPTAAAAGVGSLAKLVAVGRMHLPALTLFTNTG